MAVKLKVVYDTADEIPEGFTELYIERDGKFALTGVEGVKTQADIDRINEGLRKERADHTITKGKLAKFGDVDPDTIPGTLTELEELRAKMEALGPNGQVDQTKIQPVIDAAVNRALGPVTREKTQLQRDLDAARKDVTTRDGEIVELKGSITTSVIERELRDAATAGKVLGEAVSDAVVIGRSIFEIAEDGRVLTKELPGVTPGLSPKDWLKDQQQSRPYWWPASQGGGAAGGRGGLPVRAENPWTNEGWNVTAQGRYVRTHGEAKALEAAKAAGLTSLTAARPAVKAA